MRRQGSPHAHRAGPENAMRAPEPKASPSHATPSQATPSQASAARATAPETSTAKASQVSPSTAGHDFLAPVFARYPLEVVSAEGVWLRNSRGERILDLYGGHAVAALGYAHPGFTRALTEQAQACNFQTNAVPMQVRLRAAERLVRFSA